MIIRIYHEYIDNKFSVVEKINKKFSALEMDVEIKLIEYDDNRVYQTGERARDSRLDCCTVRGGEPRRKRD